MTRGAPILAVWIAIAIAVSSALSCTRIVDLDRPLPDAGFGGPDAAPLSDGGLGSDGGTIGDASIAIPDAAITADAL
jgi:hypothetical protein